jgi:hypothetical protein
MNNIYIEYLLIMSIQTKQFVCIKTYVKAKNIRIVSNYTSFLVYFLVLCDIIILQFNVCSFNAWCNDFLLIAFSLIWLFGKNK